MTARSPSPSSKSISRADVVGALDHVGSRAERAGLAPRQEHDVRRQRLELVGPGDSFGRVEGGGLEDHELRAEVERGIRRRELLGELAELPLAVVAPASTEHLPEGWQVGGILDPDRGGVHLLEPLGRQPDGHALSLGQRQHPVGVVGVDDARAAVAELSPGLEDLGADLDAGHVAALVEHLAGVDDRVGDSLQVGHATTLGS